MRYTLISILILHIVLSLSAYSAEAAILTVCPNPLDLCDNTTIQGAIDEANPGDVLDIGHDDTAPNGGAYEECVNVTKPLSLIGSPDADSPYGLPIINISSNMTLNCKGIEINADNVTIANLTILPDNEEIDGWEPGIFVNKVNNTMIDNVTLDGFILGIEIFSSNYTTIRRTNLTGGYGFPTATSVAVLIAGSSHSNTSIYNNIIEAEEYVNSFSDSIQNSWNSTNQTGPNIFNGPYIGGNLWLDSDPSAYGFSEMCSDANEDGYCDEVFNVTTGTACNPGTDCGSNVDYLALYKGGDVCISCSGCSAKIQNASVYDTIYVLNNVSTAGSSCVDFDGKDNVTLDCMGNTIIGGVWYGIKMNSSSGGSNNVTIQNCSVTGFSSGIYIDNSDYNRLINTYSYNNDYGVNIISSSGNNLTDVTLQENDIYDFDISGSGSDCIQNFQNVTGSGGRPIGFYYGDSLTIENADFSELVICNSNNPVVSNVNIIGSSSKKNNGILLVQVDAATITGVNSSYGYTGISFTTDSYSNNLTDIIANDNAVSGISLMNNDYGDNSFSGLTLNNNGDAGIWIYWSNNNNNISDITAEGNTYGIYLMGDSDDVRIFNNRLEQNLYGIYFENISTNYPENNYIYNNLLNNTVNVYNTTNLTNYFNTTNMSGTNIVWGPNIGGNFWGNASGTEFSDTCTELNDSGYCNESYNVDGGNFDYLPLVRYDCPESWTCGAWSVCSGGTQTRTCTDANSCGTTLTRPVISQSCGGGGGGGGGGSHGPPATGNRSIKDYIVPGIGLINNTKLQTAIEKVLRISNMSQQARENLLRLSRSITGNFTSDKIMYYESSNTRMRSRYRYTGSYDAKNVIIFEEVPKTFASHVDDVNITVPPGTMIQVVEEDPSWIFTFSELSPGDEISITMEVLGTKSLTSLERTATEIYAEEIAEPEQPEILTEPSEPEDGGTSDVIEPGTGTDPLMVTPFAAITVIIAGALLYVFVLPKMKKSKK